MPACFGKAPKRQFDDIFVIVRRRGVLAIKESESRLFYFSGRMPPKKSQSGQTPAPQNRPDAKLDAMSDFRVQQAPESVAPGNRCSLISCFGYSHAIFPSFVCAQVPTRNRCRHCDSEATLASVSVGSVVTRRKLIFSKAARP